MKLEKEAIELIKSHEGFSAEPYLCPGEVWTIGYGHTDGVNAYTAPISEAYAEELLREDIADAEKNVRTYVLVTLSDHEYGALVSFVFNVGSGNFRRSTLLKKLNAGDRQGAADEFLRWVYGGGRKLKGLERRRKTEREMFLGKKEPPLPLGEVDFLSECNELSKSGEGHLPTNKSPHPIPLPTGEGVKEPS